MMCIADQIMEYLNSEKFSKDLIDMNIDSSLWLDISDRFGLCSGCVIVSESRIEVFGRLLHIKDPDIYKGLCNIEEECSFDIARIKLILGSERYNKVKDICYLKYDSNSGGDCDRPNCSDCIRVMYNRSITDYLLDLGLLYKSTDERLEELSKIDRGLYEIGETFCNLLPSHIYSMYFSLYRNKKTGDYCIRFKHKSNLDIDQVSSGFSLIFNTTGRLYIKSKEELEIKVGLVTSFS